MKRTFPAALVSVLAALVVGCSGPAHVAGDPVVPAVRAQTGTPSPRAADTATANAAKGSPPRRVEGFTARIDAPPVVVDAVPGQVFAKDGVLLVNRQHPLAKNYVPAWVKEKNGLHPQVTRSLNLLIAGARADGVKIVLRSAYRSYADQGAIYRREMKRQPAATVKLYFAEAGKSEHQTGLAVDVWDGVRRGFSFARTKQAAWLAEHAWEYGFIIRYPEGRTDVTGYAYESWHLRYVGTEISRQFGPHSRLTLEEFLGLA